MRSKGAVLVILLLIAFCSPAWGISLSINPPSTAIMVGEPVDVNVDISGLTNNNLGEFDIDILFDPLILTFHGYSLGSGLGDPLLDILDSSAVLVNPNTIDISVLSLIDPVDDFYYGADWFTSQSDAFTLVTLTFIGRGDGQSELVIADDGNLVLGDEWGDELTLDSPTNASVKVTAGQTPIPEPSTVLLLGAGLFSLAGLGRKKKIKR